MRRLPQSSFHARAFTILELLVVIAVIAILAAMLLPMLAKAKAQGLAVACRNNLKQLQAGWRMYVDENNDWIPPNISRRIGWDQVNVAGAWVLGNACTDTNSANLEEGVLFRYLGGVAAYHCPADHSTVSQPPGLPRTRSYSTHQWNNCDVISGTGLDDCDSTTFNKRKFVQLVDPPPCRAWVFIDEHEVSIDDGIFVLHNRWYAPEATDFWESYPADRHHLGANLSFADGHTDYHRWRFLRSASSYVVGKKPIANSNDLADLQWLMDGTPHTP
jgi:prepilin-type N-terminal cleavage/methylation domain-containing protein/prepilin-type processing-associated H-X9-DG protein